MVRKCWARRVPCKKSEPNPTNSPPVKKKKLLAERIEDESQHNNPSSARRLPFSHQKIGKEVMSDLENEGEEATAETEFSADGGDSENELLQQNTVRTLLSAEGCDSDLQDMLLQQDTGNTDFSDGGGDSDSQDMSHQKNTAETDISAEEDNSDLRDMPLQKSTFETHLSSKGGDSDLQDVSPQYDNAATNFSAEESESYVPDTYLQYDAAEVSNELACHVCTDAEATIAVLPCRHLCLCLDCELECDKCPVCGGPKNGYFYKGS